MEASTRKITGLRMEHITKRFPGVLACSDISLSVGEGEILALVGENGAGKTTLMNILMGLYRPDEGRVLINGGEAVFRSPVTPSPQGWKWCTSSTCWYRT